MIFDFQYQILCGTILGGASLLKSPQGKNYYLSMRGNNEKWLKYKMAQMPMFFKTPKIHLYGNTYRCNSSCNSSLTEIQGMFYEQKKRKITMRLLDPLRDVALATWYLDSGGKTGRDKKNAYLNTTRFGQEGSEIIKKYFTEVDMSCNINHDSNRLKVLFTVKGTVNLFKTIAHQFPPFMYYRL